jgi:RNA polymerase sigma-70 factor (ECF subfamily)
MRIVSGIFMQITTELLESCESNDRRGQKKLYEVFFKMHISLCFSYLANEEDARMMLNTAFLKVCNHIGTVKSNPVVFYSWSRKIVLNCILDEFRRTKRIHENEVPKEFDREMEFESSSHNNNGLESLLEEDLKELIASLPDNMRTAFMMFAVEGYSHKEICEALHITEGTSKWLVHEARKTLRQLIEKTNTWNNQKMVI